MFASINRPGCRGGRRTHGETMRAVIAAALLLAGCNGQIGSAEHQYEIVKKGGSASEICAAGRHVADAYLRAEDAEGYRTRKVETDIDCQRVRLDEQDRARTGGAAEFEAAVDAAMTNSAR